MIMTGSHVPCRFSSGSAQQVPGHSSCSDQEMKKFTSWSCSHDREHGLKPQSCYQGYYKHIHTLRFIQAHMALEVLSTQYLEFLASALQMSIPNCERIADL